MKGTLSKLSLTLTLLLVMTMTSAQSQITRGLYQIVSGDYAACCGIAGTLHSSLPNDGQAFVRLATDPQSNLSALTFLGAKLTSIYSVSTCAPNDPINFSFGFGIDLPNSIIFHVDPGPPPAHLFWNYSVSNSAGMLRIDGEVGIDPSSCSDVPNHFTHSNVLAVLVTEPKISLTEFAHEGPVLMIQGQAGKTNVIEASADLFNWVGLSTNVMPDTDCPICPFISFRDSAATNLNHRFYRAFEVH